jgi:hypothetical protein
MSAVAKVSPLKPPAMIDYLVSEIDAFAVGREPHDDQTLVAVGIG